jgi:hypothetical protein
MTHEPYKTALDAACRELETLAAQRVDLDRRIAQLSQTVGSLLKLCGFEPTVPLGLTDACRVVLRAAAQPLTVAELRAQLHAMGIDLSRYENEAAVIHTTLKRLTESGDVRFIARGWGKPAYQWTSPDRPLFGGGTAAKALTQAARHHATAKKAR